LAHRLANASSHTIPYSDIPLIVHQTWKDTIITTWPEDIAQGLEKWLQYAAVPGDASMAYFLWLDDGCEWLIEEAEPGLVESVNALPQMVEKMDVFRIIVCNTIGGIVSLPKTSIASHNYCDTVLTGKLAVF
jgi:mannosyltransferase OCH1-like enzyme